MSWILPFIPTPNLWEYFTTKNNRSADQWVGPVEAIVALAYKRFRPGAKLKIDSFRITNDHSHAVLLPNKQSINWQSVKRTLLGGKAADMYNLKNPVFYSFIIINLLPEEKGKLLMELANQSVDNMMKETYSKDIIAQECLHRISQIIKGALKGDNLNTYKEYMNISDDYIKNPLTEKNMEVWKENIRGLEDICDQFAIAIDKNIKGEDYELNLKNIRIILDRVRDEMESYYQKILSSS